MNMNSTTDLAIVNLPLARRGNIDSQLDRHFADKRKAQTIQRKAVAAQFRADKAAAAVAYVEQAEKVSALIESTVAKYPNLSRSGVAATIEGWVKNQPAKFLKWMAA